MATFTCQTAEQGKVFIIRSNGYLDESGGACVQQHVLDALPKGFRHFVLNLAGSPVINSQGIAQIIELTETVVEEKSGGLAFVGLNELTSGVFKMVGLLQMGDSFATEDEAVQSFQA